MQTIKRLVIFLTSVLACLYSLCAFSIQLDTRPITPIPANLSPTKREQTEILLGQKLFNDVQLSGSQKHSCASCHNLKTGGTKPTPNGTLSIPSIFNAQYNFKQFWNARANTLEEAIELSLLAPDMMAFNPQKDLARIRQSKGYANTITLENIVRALAAYIRTLNTPDSKFDLYLAGNTTALSESEKKGYALFQSYGCASCHQGRLVGGNILEKFGIYNNYFQTKPLLKPFDLGYYQVTKNPADQFVFKVPSLRNVALTAPYLHDSSINTLNETVEKMAFYQLGRPISSEDVRLIVEFLNTLTGQIPNK